MSNHYRHLRPGLAALGTILFVLQPAMAEVGSDTSAPEPPPEPEQSAFDDHRHEVAPLEPTGRRRGEAVIEGLGLGLTDEDSLAAASELSALASVSTELVCGTVSDIAEFEALLDGRPFPKTVLGITSAEGSPSQSVSFFGRIGDEAEFTSATPDVSVNDSACIFVTDMDGELWITGKNAYLRAAEDATVGLGKVRGSVELMDAVVRNQRPIRKGR